MTRAVKYVSLVCALLLVGALVPAATATAAVRRPGSYSNPLRPTVPGGGTVDSCADPTVFRGRTTHARTWYMYCTTDPLNDRDTAGTRPVTFHPVPMMTSRDLVHWRYRGDALPDRPSWASSTAAMWAPDVVYSRTYHRYYLTFVVTDTTAAVSGEEGTPEEPCVTDSAIGVATSPNPTGPWRVSDRPLVAPRRAGPGCSFYWTFDPDVLGESVARSSVLYYGSYFGGVFAQRVRLSARGMATTGTPRRVVRGQGTPPAVDPVALRRGVRSSVAARGSRAAAEVQVAIGNRYEGANVVRRGRWYYLFGSATNCCNGPLTGYSVFAGRSRSPLGPFRDREGNLLTAGRVGGTPVLSMNGNRWVGTGHNTVFRDFGGQWWTVYHAVDRFAPYFTTEPGFTKRPALLDPVDWVRGWPSVRSGRWASEGRMPAPAAQPGQRSSYRPHRVAPLQRGALLPRFSDEFRTPGGPGARWRWVRPPEDGTYGVRGGRFHFPVQAGDLSNDTNTAAVLTEPTPRGDYVVETKVRLDVPPEGCPPRPEKTSPCYNFVQAGLVVYGSDDSFIKLSHVSIYETRQTEFAKEVPTAPTGRPRYGNTVVGAPGDVTWLRIVRHTRGARHLYTPFTSQDGRHWVRGGTWAHSGLGDQARIGLVSMGGEGQGGTDFNADFDYVRVWRLRR